MDEIAEHIASTSRNRASVRFPIRLYPLFQPPSSGEARFGNAFDSKAGYCKQAAAQNAIAGKARQRRFCHRGHVQDVELRSAEHHVVIFLTGMSMMRSTLPSGA
ncbi:hypothetical protein [Mesorhizobium sp.]|uniref:hypothetical protein n=1 Tax=Mesorhizobium sp. TaxID=1871066 RepID=UPI0025B7A95C|nr:hypothetical protein [Mesorhizobium sp.]